MSAPLRSFLFVPGDSEKKLSRSMESGADALILDLEDSVSDERKQAARELVHQFLHDHEKDADGPQLWVRMNPVDSAHALHDLAAVVRSTPAGIMIPKIDGPAEVLEVHHYLDAFEVAGGIERGRIRVLPVATETPTAPLRLGDFVAAALPRLYGLTWGAEDLSAALGASRNTEPGGDWAFTYRLVRSMTLMAARAAGREAVETLHVDIRDSAGLAESTRRARAEGFSGRIAVHPAQVEVINDAFTPTAAEIDYARRVVEALSGDVGTVSLDGKMLDAPHLAQARRVLALAAVLEPQSVDPL